jgi:hypothetical protein
MARIKNFNVLQCEASQEAVHLGMEVEAGYPLSLEDVKNSVCAFGVICGYFPH